MDRIQLLLKEYNLCDEIINIVCTLKYKKTIDEEGKEHKTDYRVTFVSKHGVDDNYEETLEGKKKRIEDEQPTLFDDMNF